MASRGTYGVCTCGHRDDWHQTLRDDVMLDEQQKPCYGVQGSGCSCPGWERMFSYGNAAANAAIDRAYNPEDVEARLIWARIPFERG